MSNPCFHLMMSPNEVVEAGQECFDAVSMIGDGRYRTGASFLLAGNTARSVNSARVLRGKREVLSGLLGGGELVPDN